MSAIEKQNGNGTQRPLFAAQLTPTGVAVLAGEDDQFGSVTVLHLTFPGGQLNVILGPDTAEKVGGDLQGMARQARSGLQVAGPSDVERIAVRRERTEEMRKAGPKRPDASR